MNNISTFIRKSILAIVFLGLMAGAIYLANDNEKTELTSTYGRNFVTAKVTAITKDNLQEDGNRYGDQKVKVRITSGSHKGEEIEGISPNGNLFGVACSVGMKVIVIISESGNTLLATVYSRDRMIAVIGFAVVFIILLGIIGGKKGLKSGFCLIFTLVSIIGIFLPVMYRGFSPVLAAIILATIVTVFTMFFVSGFSGKSVCAIIGTVTGVIIAVLSAVLFGMAAGIDGYNVSDVEELIYVANSSHLKVSQLLFAGILISALGAVMDVGMSISSAINEIHVNSPELNSTQLFRSGMNVGKDMMGTMSNTLILAFVGGSLSTLVLNYAYSLPYLQLINGYNIGIEVMQGVSGSIGIIMTVPITSAISAFWQGRKSNDQLIN